MASTVGTADTWVERDKGGQVTQKEALSPQ